MDMVAAMANHGGVATVTVRGSSGRRLSIQVRLQNRVTGSLKYALDFYHLTYNVVFTPQNEGRRHAMRRDDAETVSWKCARAPHTHGESLYRKKCTERVRSREFCAWLPSPAAVKHGILPTSSVGPDTRRPGGVCTCLYGELTN